MSWKIVIVPEVRGRPLVDTLTRSSVSNLKELRPGSSGNSEVRMLFVFGPWRQAVFLVAGDKSGSWSRWYDGAIDLAELRYARHLEEGKE